VSNSLRAALSLARRPEATDWVVLGAAVVILGLTVLVFVRDPLARERLRRARGWMIWGAAWFALATASLVSIHPFWAPNRVQFASLGLGVAAVTFTAAAHPALAAGLVVVRLGALAIAPGVPAVITPEPEERGAFMDFVRLTRLQRLMRASREALKRAHPTLTPGATIGYRNLPLSTAYAFGGPHAVQAWYGDPTLQWIDFQEFEREPRRPVVAFIDYQPPPHAPVAVLDPDALRWMGIAKEHLLAGRAEPALVALARADSLERDPSAAIFLGDNAGRRAAALISVGRYDEAEREARTALRTSRLDVGARYVLALTWLAKKDRPRALAEIDSLLRVAPRDPDALELRAAIIDAERR
jgi:tetratricopeptide (TPR) repeat protein